MAEFEAQIEFADSEAIETDENDKLVAEGGGAQIEFADSEAIETVGLTGVTPSHDSPR